MKTLGIAVLNRGDLLLKCILSADAEIENLFIVNNGNHGDVEEVCKKIERRDFPNNQIFKNIRVDRPGRNLGTGPSWNHIFKSSPGPWLISGNDVEFKTGAVAACRRAVESHPEVSVFFADGYSTFVMTELGLSQVGYFDESFWPAYYEDRDHLYRIGLVGAKTATVPGFDCHHEKSATIKADPTLNNHDGLLNHYIEKWGAPPGAEAWIIPYNGAR